MALGFSQKLMEPYHESILFSLNTLYLQHFHILAVQSSPSIRARERLNVAFAMMDSPFNRFYKCMGDV